MAGTTHGDRPARGPMTYPSGGWRKLFFKMPIYLWRLGLGWALPRQFLLLTQTGRKSGAPRRTMLEHYRYGDAYYVVSGWGPRTQWFQNVQADPRVTVQTWRDGATAAQGAVVQGDAELTGLYHHFKQTSPFWGVFLKSLDIQDNVEDFLAKKDRLLIVRFTPTTQPRPEGSLPPQPADLLWVWGVLVALAVVVWAARR